MSHTMNIQLEMLDRDAIQAAAERLGLTCSEGSFKIFSTEVTGTSVKLAGWNFPVVIKSDGSVSYDNYGGRWGDAARLNEFTAHYGIEKAKIEARRQGYSVIEGLNEETKELELTICVEG